MVGLNSEIGYQYPVSTGNVRVVRRMDHMSKSQDKNREESYAEALQRQLNSLVEVLGKEGEDVSVLL